MANMLCNHLVVASRELGEREQDSLFLSVCVGQEPQGNNDLMTFYSRLFKESLMHDPLRQLEA